MISILFKIYDSQLCQKDSKLLEGPMITQTNNHYADLIWY